MNSDTITIVIAVAYFLGGLFWGGIIVDHLHTRKRKTKQ